MTYILNTHRTYISIYIVSGESFFDHIITLYNGFHVPIVCATHTRFTRKMCGVQFELSIYSTYQYIYI